MNKRKGMTKSKKIWQQWWFWGAIVLLFIIVPSDKSDKTNEKLNDTNNKKEETETSNDIVNEEIRSNEYADDDVINKFISDFKSTSNYELTDIKKGNIRTKYFAYINGQYCEFLNAIESQANYFQIIIYGGNKTEDIDKIVSVYKEVIKTLDSTISETHINNTMEEHIKNPANSYNINDNITVKFFPIVELSWGKSECRIEITTTIYN